MNWIENVYSQLAARPVGGYSPQGPPATEPTALAALALALRGDYNSARRAGDWLARVQSSEGSLGINADHPWPRWPTALAVLAWSVLAGESSSVVRFSESQKVHSRRHTPTGGSADYETGLRRAVDWILSQKGKALPRENSVLGHDTRLIAWPWVEGTHSWIEPTAMHVLALKAAGRGEHPRTREAVALLIDRQLKTGGCNYGNTVVLGQQLRPHVQPTGLALLALAGEPDKQGRISQSLRYLQQAVSPETTTTSLCWALLALTAHGRRPAEADAWLQAAACRRQQRGAATHRLALLALAAANRRQEAKVKVEPE